MRPIVYNSRILWQTHVPPPYPLQVGCLTGRKPLDGDARRAFGQVGQVAAVGAEADGPGRLVKLGKCPHTGQALKLKDADSGIQASGRQQPVE